MSSTRAQLMALLNASVLTGGSRTTAQLVRDYENEAIDSNVNKSDDFNAEGGFLGITSGRVDSSKINSASPTGLFLRDDGAWHSIPSSLTPLFDHYVDAGNLTTTKTDLYSDTISAGQLALPGDKIEFKYGGIYAGNATATSQITIEFAGNIVIDTSAVSVPVPLGWMVDGMIMRQTPSIIRYTATFHSLAAVVVESGSITGLNLSNANIFKITGQESGSGASTNDIVAKIGSITYIKNA